MITTRDWEDVTDEELMAAGNVHVKIFGPTLNIEEPEKLGMDDEGLVTGLSVYQEAEGVVFEGIMGGWQETPTGSLSMRRLVQIRDDIRMGVEFGQIAPGRWWRVETLDMSIDVEAICEKHDADMAAQEAQRAAAEQQEEMNRQAMEMARVRAAAQPPLQVAQQPGLVGVPGGSQNREQGRHRPKP